MDNNEPTKMGRPTIYDEAMIQVSVMMPDELANWLYEQPDGFMRTIRALVEKAMSADKKPKKK